MGSPSDPSQEEWDQVYLSLGRGISRWAHVEHSLGRVFGICAGPGNPFIAEQAFYSISSFGGQLDATHRMIMVLSASHRELEPEWHPLRKRIQEASELRNKLAHGLVKALLTPDKSKFEVMFRPFYYERSRVAVLAEHATTTRKQSKWETPEPMGVSDLEMCVSTFTQLHFDIDRFHDRLARVRAEKPI